MTREKTNQLLLNMKTALVVLTMLAGVFVFGTTASSAATVRLNNITIPRGGVRTSRSFQVSDRGTFTARVRVRTNTLIGYGGQSRYRVQLLRGNTVVRTRERTVSSGFENVFLNYTVPNCASTGTYRIRVRNISTDNPQEGIASFPQFDVPSLTPSSGNLSLFGVKQGNVIDRPIPNNRQPSGSGGRIRITATWDGICLPDVKGCKLRFRLKRNGATRSSDLGYAHNSLLAGTSEKMTISYLVPANLVTGTWSLQIVGDSRADVNNVRTKVSFTPVCQN
jgi:hypothetical protein